MRLPISQRNMIFSALVCVLLLIVIFSLLPTRRLIKRLNRSRMQPPYHGVKSPPPAPFSPPPRNHSTGANTSRHHSERAMRAFFKKQAMQRRSIFEWALEMKNPTVPEVLLHLTPEAHCPFLVRVGTVGEGGKWVCNPWSMPKGGVIVSLGTHDDMSFESDFQQATDNAATIIMVDTAVRTAEELGDLSRINVEVAHATIANSTEPKMKPPRYTAAALMKKMGHDHIEIIKVDDEESEVTVLPQFLDNNSVCQITVEIDEIANAPKLLRDVANAGFLLQHFELNPLWSAFGHCDYSFIHESCLEKYGATMLASYIRQ